VFNRINRLTSWLLGTAAACVITTANAGVIYVAPPRRAVITVRPVPHVAYVAPAPLHVVPPPVYVTPRPIVVAPAVVVKAPVVVKTPVLVKPRVVVAPVVVTPVRAPVLVPII
jgi:hypothetical protein